MAMEEEEGEGEVAALLHHYLNMVEVIIIIMIIMIISLNLEPKTLESKFEFLGQLAFLEIENVFVAQYLFYPLHVSTTSRAQTK